MNILITGVAGFIGHHLSKRLMEDGHDVTGIDNLNSDVSLKKARLKKLKNLSFFKIDISKQKQLQTIFKNFDIVINLAARAGVKYSLENPNECINSNVTGFINILECCRTHNIKKLIFASSSSVYGANTKLPSSEKHNVDNPISLYAASKKSNELMAYTYSHLYDISCIGLRLFTVFGPWGRPDMALFLFTKAIIEGRPIKVYNHGNSQRDFTYIDDVVECIVRLMDISGYKIYNIGSDNPINLMDFIHIIEESVGKRAIIEYLDIEPWDVPASHANISRLIKDTGYKPNTPIKTGVNKFVEWFKVYGS